MSALNHLPGDVPLHRLNSAQPLAAPELPGWTLVTESPPCAHYSKPLSEGTLRRIAAGVARHLQPVDPKATEC